MDYSLKTATRRAIERALDKTRCNVKEAAALLGIDRGTVHRHIREWMEEPDLPDEPSQPSPGNFKSGADFLAAHGKALSGIVYVKVLDVHHAEHKPFRLWK